MKICKPEYLAQVGKLSKVEQEKLLSRMVGKLPKRLQKEKLTAEEAMAIQLEIEDEQLQEWRDRMQAIKVESEKKATKQVLKADKKQVPSLLKGKAEKPAKVEKQAKVAKPVKPEKTSKEAKTSEVATSTKPKSE